MLHEVKFQSFNERDEVYGWIYVPAAKPKGIVQVIHGYGEHSRRYLHMIVRFMDAGFIVAADDHVGHGKTALENDTWGDWGDKGCHTMMEDEHGLLYRKGLHRKIRKRACRRDHLRDIRRISGSRGRGEGTGKGSCRRKRKGIRPGVRGQPAGMDVRTVRGGQHRK